MPTSIAIPLTEWPIGTFSATFDTPPAESTGYSVSLNNRPNWPPVQCFVLSVDVSFDGETNWQAASENTFFGAVIGKGGVPMQVGSIASGWGSIIIDGVMTEVRPTHVRITTNSNVIYEAGIVAGWTF